MQFILVHYDLKRSLINEAQVMVAGVLALFITLPVIILTLQSIYNTSVAMQKVY